MNPDLEKRVPREILAELIEEGTEAFRGILEKLFNVAMQSSFWESVRENSQSIETDSKASGFSGRAALGDSTGAWVEVLSQVAGEGLPFGEGPEAGHCRDVCDGRLDEESHRDHGAAVWVGDLGHPGLESGRDAGRRAGRVSKPGAGRVSDRVSGCPLREGSKRRQGAGRGQSESHRSQSFRDAGGVGSEHQDQ